MFKRSTIARLLLILLVFGIAFSQSQNAAFAGTDGYIVYETVDPAGNLISDTWGFVVHAPGNAIYGIGDIVTALLTDPIGAVCVGISETAAFAINAPIGVARLTLDTAGAVIQLPIKIVEALGYMAGALIDAVIFFN
jgi:hypothetical protein